MTDTRDDPGDGRPDRPNQGAWNRGRPPASPARGGSPMVALGRAVAPLLVAAMFALSLAVQASGAWQSDIGQARAYLPPEPTCRDFVAAETIIWSANRYWLGGFLSAYNMLAAGSGNIGGGADYEQMVAWLVERCSKQPDLSFLDAVTALIAALEQRPR